MIRATSAMLAIIVCLSAVSHAQSDSPTPSRPAVEATAPVNLNTATQAQLEALPGIGAATAVRILEYRQKNGGFKKVEDLMNVRGVGEKSFLRLKPLITVSAPRASQ